MQQLNTILPPAIVVSDTQHGAWITITSALGLAVTCVFLSMRVYVRVAIAPPFGLDDIALGVGFVFLVIQDGMMMHNVKLGLGSTREHMNQENEATIQKLYYVSGIFIILVSFTSKFFVVYVFLRLTPRRSHHILCYVFATLTGIALIASICVISINCVFQTPWEDVPKTCSGYRSKIAYTGDVDIVLEISLFAFAVAVIARLQMQWEKKLIVISTFGFRVPIIIFIAIHIWHASLFMDSPGDPTFTIVEETIWNEVIAHYSIIACTSFCLTPFMKATRTNWGEASRGIFDSYTNSNPNSKTPNYDSSKGDHNSFALKSFPKPIRTRRSSGFDAEMTDSILSAADRENANQCFWQDSCIMKHATVTNDNTANCYESASSGTDKSRKMFIRRDVDFSIHYDSRSNVS